MTADQCYFLMYPDVANSGMSAPVHYAQYGKAAGYIWGCYKLVRIPNSTTQQEADNYYLRHPDVKNAGLGALDHYNRWGKAAGYIWGNFNIVPSDAFAVVDNPQPGAPTTGATSSSGTSLQDFILSSTPGTTIPAVTQTTGTVQPNVIGTSASGTPVVVTPTSGSSSNTTNTIIGLVVIVGLAYGGYRLYKSMNK